MDSVDSAVYSVRDSSVSWGFYLDREQTPQVYARNVAGFPFNIIYLLTDRDVVVLAYAHEKRRPGYWTTRLTG